MDTDAELQDLEERVLGVFEEAMDIAYREGVRDALDAAGVIALSVAAAEPDYTEGCACGCQTTEPTYDPSYDEDTLLAALDAIGEFEPEVEYCPCGCGLTSEDLGQFVSEDEEEPDEYIELSERLTAVEEYVGLKYTG